MFPWMMSATSHVARYFLIIMIIGSWLIGVLRIWSDAESATQAVNDERKLKSESELVKVLEISKKILTDFYCFRKLDPSRI